MDLDGLKVKGDDQKAGVEIVKKALQAPVRQITANAGVDGSVVVGKLIEGKKASQGYDAQNEEYVDMFAKGIIDPTKVVRSALQDAASIAGLLVTTEAMIACCLPFSTIPSIVHFLLSNLFAFFKLPVIKSFLIKVDEITLFFNINGLGFITLKLKNFSL